MLPSTITPTAPRATDRFSSPSARLGCCQGRLASQRIRSGQARWAAAISSLVALAASRLTSGPPQNTFGQVRLMIAKSTPASSMRRMRSS
jgi:hypothetical protein